jgi:hypothetical protein
MPLTKKRAGTRESKALSGRGAAAASDRVAYNGLSMRAGHGIVRAVAYRMKLFATAPESVSAKIRGKDASPTDRPRTMSRRQYGTGTLRRRHDDWNVAKRGIDCNRGRTVVLWIREAPIARVRHRTNGRSQEDWAATLTERRWPKAVRCVQRQRRKPIGRTHSLLRISAAGAWSRPRWALIRAVVR